MELNSQGIELGWMFGLTVQILCVGLLLVLFVAAFHWAYCLTKKQKLCVQLVAVNGGLVLSYIVWFTLDVLLAMMFVPVRVPLSQLFSTIELPSICGPILGCGLPPLVWLLFLETILVFAVSLWRLKTDYKKPERLEQKSAIGHAVFNLFGNVEFPAGGNSPSSASPRSYSESTTGNSVNLDLRHCGASGIGVPISKCGIGILLDGTTYAAPVTGNYFRTADGETWATDGSGLFASRVVTAPVDLSPTNGSSSGAGSEFGTAGGGLGGAIAAAWLIPLGLVFLVGVGIIILNLLIVYWVTVVVPPRVLDIQKALLRAYASHGK